MHEDLVGRDDQRSFECLNVLAIILANRGEKIESVEISRLAVERETRVLDPDHRDTLNS